jgi:F0F1-type ATP synthase assembly protein I
MPEKPRDSDKKNQVVTALASAGEFVLAMAILAALGVWVGTKIDESLHTSPWFTISLALVGVCLGLARMVLKAIATEKK